MGGFFRKMQLKTLLSPLLPLQPIEAHSYMTISVMGGNSWNLLPLQPIAALSYMAISVRGVIP